MHIVSYQIDSMVIDRLIKKSYEDVLMNKQEVSISMLELSLMKSNHYGVLV